MCEGRKEINGIPLFMGETEDGKPYVQRFAFTTLYSDAIRTLVRDSRFEPIRTLVDEGARIGERENDGVVVNRYVNRKKSITIDWVGIPTDSEMSSKVVCRKRCSTLGCILMIVMLSMVDCDLFQGRISKDFGGFVFVRLTLLVIGLTQTRFVLKPKLAI